MTMLRTAFTGVLCVLAACSAEQRAPRPPAQQVITVQGAGLQTPESVLYDGQADVYLASNINGSPVEKDDNGFISRISPEGTVVALKWIDGAAGDVTLNAPKGMGIKGDTLFVADIDAVRLFHRTTGAPLGSRQVPGASFLNDVAVGPDGTVYFTDSGLKASAQGFAATGSDAVYRFDPAGKPVPVVKDSSLGRPNGVLADSAGLVVVTFGSSAVFRLDASGRRTDLTKPPAGSLDGVVRAADGSLLVSSWDGKAVYRLSPAAGATWTTAADSVESPADIGYDGKRQRLLIPLFTPSAIRILPVQ